MFFVPQAFNDAYNLVEPSASIGEVLTPYVIENYTGMDIVLKLDTSFEVCVSSSEPGRQ